MYSLPLPPRREVYRHGVELFQDFVAYVDFRRVCERGVCGDDERHSFFVYFEPVSRAFAQRVHDERRHARVLTSVLRVELRLFLRRELRGVLRLRVLLPEALEFRVEARAQVVDVFLSLRLASRLSTYFCPALPGALASITRATSITATSARAGAAAARAHSTNSSAVTAFTRRICLSSFLFGYVIGTNEG